MTARKPIPLAPFACPCGLIVMHRRAVCSCGLVSQPAERSTLAPQYAFAALALIALWLAMEVV